MKSTSKLFPFAMLIASFLLGCIACVACAEDVPQPKTVPVPVLKSDDSIGIAYPPTPLKSVVSNPVQAVKNVVDMKMHSHTCPNGHTWIHSDHSFGVRADHMCPICGAGPVWNQNTAKVQRSTSVTDYVFRGKSNCPGGVCPVPSRSYSAPRFFRR